MSESLDFNPALPEAASLRHRRKAETAISISLATITI